MMTRILLIGSAIMVMGAVGAAEVYKWVDANGQTQYSDQPPPGNVKRDVVRIHQSGGVIPTQGSAPSAREAERSGKDSESAKKPEQAAEQASAKDACKRATERLQEIEDAASHSATDAKGKERELTPTEVNTLLANARKDKAQQCARAR